MFVELLAERGREKGQLGLLLKSMYGTRDAVAKFAAIVMDTLTKVKLEGGNSIRASAHRQATTSGGRK